MKIYHWIIACCLLLPLGGCSNWLDVIPEDSVDEKDLFSTGEGYRNALNGVYRQMSQTSMYGQQMSWGFIDVLGQLYNTQKLSNYSAYGIAGKNYAYRDETVKSVIQVIWSNTYNSIANCNNIVGRITGEDPSKFRGGEAEQHMIQGEALALRAFLHFDLLRLWAPAPVTNPSGNYMPYFENYPSTYEPDKSVQGKETLAKEDFESSLVRPNAVYLFGPFTVIDRNGRDITHLFSSRLRQVFIYILLHSTHNGVLSASLNEVFWPDKPDDKVKNLKGVTINQIRKNLAELDGVELVHDKGYFRLVFTDCYCDYFRFRTLKNAEEVENELGILLMRGKFLDGMDAGMMDHFKQKVEEFLSSFLPLEIERLYQQHKYDAVIRFCNVLFRVDPVNELALAYGMHALNHTGSSQEAILQYSLFVREYRQMMNEEYSTSYAELMSKNPPFHR